MLRNDQLGPFILARDNSCIGQLGKFTVGYYGLSAARLFRDPTSWETLDAFDCSHVLHVHTPQFPVLVKLSFLNDTIIIGRS